MGLFARSRTAAVAVVLSTAASCVLAAAPARAADGPGAGEPWVVSVGDSYISGEAGRWAGNSDSLLTNPTDTGADAYFDNADHTAERIPGCHRSKSAEIHLGGGVRSENLACSGATTATDATGAAFKPGIDFYQDATGRKGQARMLQEFAAGHRVKMVALSIGGNDFGFAEVVQKCLTTFVLGVTPYCKNDATVTGKVAPAEVARLTGAIAGAIDNIHTAMAGAGYADGDYTIVVQNYPGPMRSPAASNNRYGETYGRQTTGGCGVYNTDIDWLLGTFLTTVNSTVAASITKAATDHQVTNTKALNLRTAFDGRTLCEKPVNVIENTDLATGTSPGAQDKLEWVSQIYTATGVLGSHQLQEGLHPDYWGQLALRNCLRRAYADGTPQSGTCTRDTAGGTDAQGEPAMLLG
ncbi:MULTISPECIES: hypothetical protein [Kitasatospora]|uniref:SGNH hydrolase-type esterase domain-containing protein n=1 Tax=Kitasatospora setae (strain ATCC 33774 / DSM 43861 / JCM 3304 / KCC A-0304 / NBRC 14216 / KM-6054) TaxID=452652 RepID=E4N778_KITSK|nr:MULTISPECIES: hypothetical protein [Kitasatospora]BAJ27059.1 hypothetical protein KSE_12260 [Kitasatospora setae KM-6054]